MKIAVWGSLILAAMIAAGFGGYPPFESRRAAALLNRTCAQPPTAPDVRAYINTAQLQVRTEGDREILREFEQIVDFADKVTSGELHDRLMQDIAAAMDQANTGETLNRIRGQAVGGAHGFQPQELPLRPPCSIRR